MALADRSLDVVVFGASGDTGAAACCCLYFRGKSLGLKSWAPAARNLGKLKADVLDKLKDQSVGEDGLSFQEPIEADSKDHEALVKMCKKTRCVVACAGPYSQYGEGVVRACAETGTNYVDVTGEVPWVQKMERKYGQQALANGATIVSLAGYDSVPPDLSTYLAAKALQKQNDRLQRFDLFAGGGGGAMPTGTINTLVYGVDVAKAEFWRIATFGLVGGAPKKADAKKEEETQGSKVTYVPEDQAPVKASNLFWSMCPGFSTLAKQFCLPHFMAPINVNVVHRTAAQEGYGGLVYRERMGGLPDGFMSLFGLLPTLGGIASGLLLGFFLPLPKSTSVILWIRDRFNPPLSAKARAKMLSGYSSTGETFAHGYGVSEKGVRVETQLKCSYDPGLAFTVLSACSVAATIVKKSAGGEKAKPGFQTAVSAVGGESLAEVFRAQGMTVEVTVGGATQN
mmetsp:Transcript_97966/g.204355  ORF Transcript_97966/g.204355 Transcript_97966/m.204355 type:complete len:455 (+) Transcript_97966:103-1467(+)